MHAHIFCANKRLSHFYFFVHGTGHTHRHTAAPRPRTPRDPASAIGGRIQDRVLWGPRPPRPALLACVASGVGAVFEQDSQAGFYFSILRLRDRMSLSRLSLTRAENRPFASKLSFATKKNGKTGTSEDIIRLAKVLTRNKIESRRAGTGVIRSFGVHDGL